MPRIVLLEEPSGLCAKGKRAGEIITEGCTEAHFHGRLLAMVLASPFFSGKQGDHTVRRYAILLVCGTLLLLATHWLIADTKTDSQPASMGEQSSDELVDTFVLTPIRMEAVSMEVPAAIIAPMSNETCKDWITRTETCYLPAHVLATKKSQAWPGLVLWGLLERHLSAVLGTWKTGAWPGEGGNVTFDLERKATIEHLWLTTRIDLTERVGSCWLTAKDDPYQSLARAAAEPAASLEIEVFDGTRNASGFPKKTPPLN